jgi:hypothetical protein
VKHHGTGGRAVVAGGDGPLDGAVPVPTTPIQRRVGAAAPAALNARTGRNQESRAEHQGDGA